MEQLITTSEAARRLNVSAETLRRWDRQGLVAEGIYEQTKGKHRRWRAARLDELRVLVGQGCTVPAGGGASDLAIEHHLDDLLRHQRTDGQLRHQARIVAALSLVLALIAPLITVVIMQTLWAQGQQVAQFNARISSGLWAQGLNWIMHGVLLATFAALGASIMCAAVAGICVVRRRASAALWASRYVLLMGASMAVAFVVVIAWTIMPPLPHTLPGRIGAAVIEMLLIAACATAARSILTSAWKQTQTLALQLRRQVRLAVGAAIEADDLGLPSGPPLLATRMMQAAWSSSATDQTEAGPSERAAPLRADETPTARRLSGWADFAVLTAAMSCSIFSPIMAFGTLHGYLGEGALVGVLGGATLALGVLLAMLAVRYRSAKQAIGAAASGAAVTGVVFVVCLARLIISG